MSIDSISDVLSRITAIEQQLQALSDGTLLDSELGISSDGSSDSTTGTTEAADTGSTTDFADALAQAQSANSTSTETSSTDTDSSTGTLADSALESSADTGSTLDSSDDATAEAASALNLLTGGVAVGAGVTLPASASTLLTTGQQQFASTLSADTGLSPSVVSAWLLAEESGSAAQTRQAAGNNDWLNVGYTDSGTDGASDSVWEDPVTAADATAEWMQGDQSVSGYGTASSGIQAILTSVGQTPASQVQAIQDSGWSAGGYPSLAALYQQVTG